MGKVGELFIVLDTKLDRFNKGMSDAERAMVRVGQRFTAIGKKLTMMVTLPILAIGAAAVKMGADFEQSMMNAASVSGATGEELKRMEGIARDMGETTVFSARQAADAMYFMASAGWKVNDMGKAIKPILDLAAATQSDLAFATDTVVASLNQFQLGSEGAERVTNVFAAAIGNSQATMEKLNASMRYVGPLFNSLGKEVEEAAATLMVLYNAGYDASMAGTALRMGMVKLMDGTRKTTDALARLGLTLKDVDPTTMHFADIIEILGERGAKTKDVIDIFGVRAGPAFAALIAQGGDAIRKFEKDITGTDAAARMAEMQINTLKGSFKLLTSALTEAAIQIFKILGPGLKDFVDNKLKPAVLWFNNLSTGTKKIIITVAGLAAAVGPLLLIFGKLLVILPALKVALIALSGPVGIVIAGLVIIASKVPGVVAHFKNMRKSVYDFEKETENAVVSLNAFWGAIRKSSLHSKEFANAIQRHHGDVTKVMKKLADGTLKHAKNLQLAYNYVEKNALIAKKAAEDAAIAEGKLNRITNATKTAQRGLRESYTMLSRGVDAYIDNLIEVAKIKGILTEERKKELEKMRGELTSLDLLYKAHRKVIVALRDKANLTPKLIAQLKERKIALEVLINAQKENYEETARIIPKIEEETTHLEDLEKALFDVKGELYDGIIGWQEYIEKAVKIQDEIDNITAGLEGLEMAIEDDATAFIDFGDKVNTVLEDMGLGLGSIPDKAKDAADKTKSAWDVMADGLQTKWASAISNAIKTAGTLKEKLGAMFSAVKDQFIDMASQMLAKWLVTTAGMKAAGAAFAAYVSVQVVGQVLRAFGLIKESWDEIMAEMEKAREIPDTDTGTKRRFQDEIADTNEWIAAIERLNKIFRHFNETGEMTLEGMKLLNDAWAIAIGLAQEYGMEGSKAFTDLIKLMREMGLESEALTKYLFDQLGVIEKGAMSAAEGLEAMAAGIGNSEAAMARLEEQTIAVYEAMIASGATADQAMESLGGTLDAIAAKHKENGTQASAAIQELLKIREVTVANEELMTAIEGNLAVLNALANTGSLTQKTLDNAALSAKQQYRKLRREMIRAGLEGNEALEQMAPTLQRLSELAEEHGFEIDNTTQALINQAKEAGYFADEQMSLNDIMLEGLAAIILALGGELPAAFQDAMDAMESFGETGEDAFEGIGDAGEDAFEDIERAMEDAAAAGEASAEEMDQAMQDAFTHMEEAANAAADNIQDDLNDLHAPDLTIDIDGNFGKINRQFEEWSSVGKGRNIPKFQHGGLVEETGLAYVHKGEWVLPKTATQSLLSADLPKPTNIQPLLGASGGQGESVMNTTVNIYAKQLDDYTINTAAEKIHAAVKRQEARSGGQ